MDFVDYVWKIRIRYSPLARTCYIMLSEGDQGWHTIHLPINLEGVDENVLLDIQRDYLKDLAKGV